MVTINFSVLCLLAAPTATGYSFVPRNNVIIAAGKPSRSSPSVAGSGGVAIGMFLGELGQPFHGKET
jgi:hypothetical protein